MKNILFVLSLLFLGLMACGDDNIDSTLSVIGTGDNTRIIGAWGRKLDNGDSLQYVFTKTYIAHSSQWKEGGGTLTAIGGYGVVGDSAIVLNGSQILYKIIATSPNIIYLKFQGEKNFILFVKNSMKIPD